MHDLSLNSTDILQSVWRNKSITVVQMAAAEIPEARRELWRRRLGMLCYKEVLIQHRENYKAKLGKVQVMPTEEPKQTMMTNPPAPGEVFQLTEGTLPTGKFDPETGEEIRTPNKIAAYCVEVAPLPGGGGFGNDGMYVVSYVERYKINAG